MIGAISINNVGGIASASLSLGKGFTVVTGESGAGKSSFVRALELIGGKRSQILFIRSGEDEASVEAVFTGEDLDLSRDMDARRESTVRARRTLSRAGRNRCFFQDKRIPFGEFSAIMNDKLRIQSQFAQMELLDPKRQMDIIDLCGGTEASRLRASLRTTISEAVNCDRELRALKNREIELRKKYIDAEAIIEAIRPLNIFPGCEPLWERELEEKTRVLQQSVKINERMLELTGGISGGGAFDRLEACGIDLIRRLSLEGTEAAEHFNEGIASIHEFVEVVRQLSSSLSPEKIECEQSALEKRLGALRKLRRATGSRNVEELTEWTADAREAILWLRESARQASVLADRVKDLRREASSLAMNLRSLRRKSASALEGDVNAHLGDLGMEETRFLARIKPLDKIRENGADDISFNIAADSSDELPVNRSASGGELSRLLLALQLSLPEETLPSTLVFDEVEAGLGGKAALLAGYKLLALSRKTQVILITHEATIAALADSHFRVRKTPTGVEINSIDGGDRIGELARMLSGDSTLQEAREHAIRLVNSAAECAVP